MKRTRTERVLMVLNVLAWIAFIGLMIQGGGDLVSWFVGLVNPAASTHLFQGQDLSVLRHFSAMHYSMAFLSMAALAVIEGYTAYLVISVLTKIKLKSPFTMEIALRLERISYITLATWLLVVLRNLHTQWLLDRLPGLRLHMVSGDFIFIAGVIFVVAQIFKKGVELQTENELTV